MNDTTHTPEPAPDRPLVYDNRSLFSDYYLRERLSDHAAWSEDVTPAFEVARRLGPDDVRVLRDVYKERVPAMRALTAEAQRLERRLADLINKAYGLTPEEVDLLWSTAPPRMPVERPGD